MHIFLVVLASLVLLVGVSSTARETLSFFWQLLFQNEVAFEKEGRVNILLLGTAGGMHEGKDLTDTIILLSLDPKKKEALLVSVPRDLWIPELSSKINTAYLYGEEKQKGGGSVLTKTVIEKVTGIEPYNVVKVDFDGFTKAVDNVGGLEITVENSFDDYGYPIPGKENDLCGLPKEELGKLSNPSVKPWEIFPCRFEHVHFEKGRQQMNGETALKFVRSRNAQGIEGTDFARSGRQQQILFAFSKKIFSLGVLLNPLKVQSLFTILRENVATDIQTGQLDDFIRLVKQMEGVSIRSVVIDYGDEENGRKGLLFNPPISSAYGSQWVLIPRIGIGQFSEIHQYVACELTSKDCKIN